VIIGSGMAEAAGMGAESAAHERRLR